MVPLDSPTFTAEEEQRQDRDRSWGQLELLRARSLGPLVKARAFGMTPLSFSAEEKGRFGSFAPFTKRRVGHPTCAARACARLKVAIPGLDRLGYIVQITNL